MAFQINEDKIVSSISNPVQIYNYLRPNGFRLTLKDLPDVSFTCQSVNLPGISLGVAVQPNPFIDIPRIGDKLTFEQFSIKFLIAEDMSNFLELYEWIVALGFPNDYTEYKSFTGERLERFPFYKDKTGAIDALGYSDGILTILDSNNNPKTNIIFKDLFPISIESNIFDVMSTDVQFLTASASFKYRSFDIEVL
jgi:hypothetical protein